MLELLARFAGPYRHYIVIGPTFKLLEVVFDLFTPLVIACMIDESVAAHSVNGVLQWGALLLVMAAVGMAFALVCQAMAARTSQGMGTDIRQSLYRHINHLSAAELDRFGTPSLITRMTNDINQVQLAVALAMRQLIRWPFLAVGSMVAALLIDWQLGLIFLITAPIIGLVFWWVMAKSIPFFKTMQAKLDRVGQITREGLSGVRVIRAFVRDDHERMRFSQAASEQTDVAIAVGKLSSILNPVTFLVMNFGICAILWIGGMRVAVGDLTQGEIVAFVNYMTQTLLSIVYVANLVVVFTKASASSSRVLEVLDCPSSVTDKELVETAPSFAMSCTTPAAAAFFEQTTDSISSTPAIAFNHVSFSYPHAGAATLHDISFDLMPGQTLGIIGGTGSGKSTLISLIPRLYNVAEGNVSLFGTQVDAWPLKQLRHVVSMVPQQASLVSGSIRSNLQWRNAEASDDELWQALETAQAAEFVRNLPQGLDAPVEAGGKNFSGGQRQRLTIARALVDQPLVLMLDDSSSALDFKTDAALRQALRNLSKSALANDNSQLSQPGFPLTTVVVSQRVSSVRDADLILVMRRGHVVGAGTHDELLDTCTVYQEICFSQFKAEEVRHG